MKAWKKRLSRTLAIILTAAMLPAWSGIRVFAADENLVQNNGFENGSLDSWTENDWCKSGGGKSEVLEQDGTVRPKTGDYFLKHTGAQNGAQITQNIKLEKGKTYWLTAYIYQNTANSLSVGFHEDEGKNGDPQFQTKDENLTGQWVQKAVRFTMWDHSEKPNLYTWQNAGTVGYVDDISLTETADYSVLEDSVAEAKEKAAKTDYYTEASIQNLQSVLSEAEELTDVYNIDNVTNTQSDINNKNQKLQDAIQKLEVQAGVGEIVSEGTFYIDAENGDDDASGTSEHDAWKTFKNVSRLRLQGGAKLLLKAGCVWNEEQLLLQDSHGTKENPIIVGSYGEGEDPVINGNGNPWQTNVNAPKEDVAAVHIYNCSFVTVENLEVTNWESDQSKLMNDGNNTIWNGAAASASGEFNGTIEYQQSKKLLTGILVENHDAGDLDGIVIQNNYVHDINGRMEPGAQKGSGAIIALVTGNQTPSSFTNLTIQGNEVQKVCHQGIYMESSWAARKLVGSQQAGSSAWKGWKDVYVANNYVNEVAGDGIVLINADGGVAEKNLVTATANEAWNYSRNPAHAAIWMWDCDNVTMQYNEAAYTESYQDGMAFDFDYGNQNLIYQYNYSHDNKGGFWMSCPGPNYTVNAVARYNISVNDGLFDGARIIRIGEKGSIGNQFHNNTMYWNHNYDVNAIEQATWGTPPSSGTDIYNNIFYGDSDHVVKNSGVTYRNNCVYGGMEETYLKVAQDPGAVTADPKFVDPSDYTDGNFQDGTVTLGDVSGFALQSDSPCIDMGVDFMEVPEESLPAVANELVKTQITIENQDYAGNPAPYEGGEGRAYVDIGAMEYQGASEKPDTDKTYLYGLIHMAEGYQKDKYTEQSYQQLVETLNYVKKEMDRPTAGQEQIDAYAKQLETAIRSLANLSYENTAETAENILESYGKEDGQDNSGFEKDKTSWGKWQSQVTVDSAKKRTGNQSLKVVQTSPSLTAYSEIGMVPVKPNTEYVLEGWLWLDDTNAEKVALEVKHHKDVTGSDDIKLGNASPESSGSTGAGEWKKVKVLFTTKEYSYVSLSVNSNISTVWLDDVVLYQRYGIPNLDTSAIDNALGQTPEHEEAWYDPDSWAAYEAAILAAKLERVNAEATEQSILDAARALEDAFQALTQKKEDVPGGSSDPENPGKPSGPSGSGTEGTAGTGQVSGANGAETLSANTGKAAKTGDTAPAGSLILLLAVSGMSGICVMIHKRRKTNDQ